MAEKAQSIPLSARFAQLQERLLKSRDLFVAVFIVGTIGIIIIPVSPAIMDFFLAVNLTLSLVLLLTTIYVDKPLDLSVFPSLLLGLTLYRLALNIATTKLILGNANTDKTEAAGQLVSLAGQVVGGGELAIGVTIFAIIVIIQFVVITKGATRIAEVAARFALDALPGQQMAIDADLNAGQIDEAQAKSRREELRALTDFYGSMDGASKFVRGDAIAGIIITVVNVMVGLIIGTVSFGMGLAEAGKVYTILTIGDGLVSQVPALLVSVAAGLLVTRSAAKTNFGEDVLGQLFGQRKALAVATLVLGAMGTFGLVVPGTLPWLPLLILSATCGATWYTFSGAAGVKAKTPEQAQAEAEAAQQTDKPEEEKTEKYLAIDPMELEVGYALVPLADTLQADQGGGGLLRRVQMIRQQMAVELGIIVPPVRIRDNINLAPNAYTIKIQGSPVAHGTAEADGYLAMDSSGQVTETVEGIETTEPAFGLPAVWITEGNREHAERVGYTVVDAETVVATHLQEIIRNRAHELITREEVRRLLDNLRESAPNLVQEVVPDLLSVADVQKILQSLLRERVSIRNLPAILEVLGDVGRRIKDVDNLTEYCRSNLARWLCHEYAEENKMYVITLDPALEDGIQQRIQHTDTGGFLALRPEQVRRIVEALQQEVVRQVQAGHAMLVLTNPQIRRHLKRITESAPALATLTVMSYVEVLPEFEVESLGMVKAELD